MNSDDQQFDEDTRREATLSELREAVAIGLEQLDRGEAGPLDIEEVIANGYARLRKRVSSD